MKTPSILSNASAVQKAVVVLGNFKEAATAKIKEKTVNEPKDAIVVGLFKNQTAGKNQKLPLIYTIKERDLARLSHKNSLLRLYHLNEPIDIPVAKLFGKLRKEHVGVTIRYNEAEWKIVGGLSETTSNSFLETIWKKLFPRRISA